MKQPKVLQLNLSGIGCHSSSKMTAVLFGQIFQISTFFDTLPFVIIPGMF